LTEPLYEVSARLLAGQLVQRDVGELACAAVCDLLESEGWETMFLGANTPQHVLLQSIEEFRPTVVGLSATWLFRVDNVRRIISQIHAQHPRVKVIIGGTPFDGVSGLAEKVGADARGGNLLELPALLQHLITPN
jgi:methanogenic corrinoid protein MtbC1